MRYKEASKIPKGLGGVEFSFSLMYHLFGDEIIDKFTLNPAKIHPKRLVADIDDIEESRKLYDAIKETMEQAIELGGRYDERDLYNNPGRYIRILDSKTRGKPCPECGTPIEKIQYLGGASYFCSSCQI